MLPIHGNLLEVSCILKDTLGKDNPFLYKGYYYDVESSLYYCNSRYYVPEWCRWLNADNVGYLDPSSVNGLNLYAYCNNNPIMYTDRYGNFPLLISLITLVVSAYMIYGGVKAYNTSKDLGYSGWSLAGYTASGLIAGDYFVVKDNWDSI